MSNVGGVTSHQSMSAIHLESILSQRRLVPTRIHPRCIIHTILIQIINCSFCWWSTNSDVTFYVSRWRPRAWYFYCRWWDALIGCRGKAGCGVGVFGAGRILYVYFRWYCPLDEGRKVLVNENRRMIGTSEEEERKSSPIIRYLPSTSLRPRYILVISRSIIITPWDTIIIEGANNDGTRG